MTIVQLVNFLRGNSVDILVLGIIDTLLTSFVKKISAKRIPKKYLTGVPFLLGVLLYAGYLLAVFQSFSCLAGRFSLLAERGFGVGCTATLYYVFFEQFLRKTDSAFKGSAALLKELLADSVDESNLDAAADELAALADETNAGADGFQGTGTTETEKNERKDKAIGILRRYAPKLTEQEISALADLIQAVFKTLKR